MIKYIIGISEEEEEKGKGVKNPTDETIENFQGFERHGHTDTRSSQNLQ